VSEPEEPSLDIRKALRYDYIRKEAIFELERATLNVESWTKLEEKERELRQHLRTAFNRVQELLRMLGPEPGPQSQPTNIT